MSTNVYIYTKVRKAHYAEKAWSNLVLLAEKRDTIFYVGLGSKIGIYNPQDVRHALSPIQKYCHAHDEIPNLTSLVVKYETGEPGTGFESKLGTAEKDREAVYAFDWKDHPNPGYAVFLEHATA